MLDLVLRVLAGLHQDFIVNSFLKFLRAQNYEFVLVRVGGSNFKYWISFRSRWDKGSSVLHWFWLIVQQVPAVGKKIFTLHL